MLPIASDVKTGSAPLGGDGYKEGNALTQYLSWVFTELQGTIQTAWYGDCSYVVAALASRLVEITYLSVRRP